MISLSGVGLWNVNFAWSVIEAKAESAWHLVIFAARDASTNLHHLLCWDVHRGPVYFRFGDIHSVGNSQSLTETPPLESIELILKKMLTFILRLHLLYDYISHFNCSFNWTFKKRGSKSKTSRSVFYAGQVGTTVARTSNESPMNHFKAKVVSRRQLCSMLYHLTTGSTVYTGSAILRLVGFAFRAVLCNVTV